MMIFPLENYCIIEVKKNESAYKTGWKYKRFANGKWKYFRTLQMARG